MAVLASLDWPESGTVRRPTIVTAIVAMGHSMDLRVIAAGVETPGQLAFLRGHGCDGMQSCLFSRPQPAAEITRLLKSGKQL